MKEINRRKIMKWHDIHVEKERTDGEVSWLALTGLWLDSRT